MAKHSKAELNKAKKTKRSSTMLSKAKRHQAITTCGERKRGDKNDETKHGNTTIPKSKKPKSEWN